MILSLLPILFPPPLLLLLLPDLLDLPLLLSSSIDIWIIDSCTRFHTIYSTGDILPGLVEELHLYWLLHSHWRWHSHRPRRQFVSIRRRWHRQLFRIRGCKHFVRRDRLELASIYVVACCEHGLRCECRFLPLDLKCLPFSLRGCLLLLLDAASAARAMRRFIVLLLARIQFVWF